MFICGISSSFSQSPPTWSNVGAGANDGCFGGGDVMAMATVGTDMYLTGWFTTIDNVAASRVAKYNGTTFTALGTGITAGGSIVGQAIAEYGGNIYVGGSFSTVGGVACSNIAMWNPGTSTWSAVGAGITGVCRTLTVYGGALYAMGGTGGFSIPAVANTNGIAKWNGTAWSAVGAGLNTINGVTPAMYVWGANLYVGGTFASATQANGSVVADTRNLAKWDGTNWSSMVPATDLGPNGAVYDMTLYGGQLVIMGAFSRVRNTVISTHIKMAQWDGTTWSVLPDMPLAADAFTPYCCTVYQTNLYVAGSFIDFSGTTGFNYTARMGVANTWTTVGSSPLNFPVYSMNVYNGGLYVGGLFGPSPACGPQTIPEHIAKINSWPLPVELISFSGNCNDNNSVKLNWATASESNNNYFTIERSINGTHFEPVGIVLGAGNSSAIREYEFSDTSPNGGGREGALYYRLKQTDYNGAFEYFPHVSVKFPCKDQELVILPNPSSGVFSVSGISPGSECVIYNLLGERIISQKVKTSYFSIDLSSWPKGVYFVKTSSGSKVNTAKIIIGRF